MNQQKYEQLKEIIKKTNTSNYKILGRSIRLADLLLSLKGKRGIVIGVDINGTFIDCDDNLNNIIFRQNWNLKDDNLDHQSDETKQFLIDLLVK